MKSAITPKALSHLYLHAVLPSLVELVRLDSTARKMIAPWNLRLSIGVVGDQPIVLHLNHGDITFYPLREGKTEINFKFLTYRHLNAFFNGNKWCPPLVSRGLFRIHFLKHFSLLTERLSTILQDSSSTTPLYTRLVFLISGLALLPLVKFDPFSQSVLEKTPAGLAEFSIGNDTIQSLWFENKKNEWIAGQGVPPRRPDVRVQFADIHIANAALRNDIDTLAAIGAKRIMIEGLAPLAEALGLIMDRLNFYLAR